MISMPGKNMRDAIDISQWLKEQGYVHQKDFIWWLDSPKKIVKFHCGDPHIETLIVLKFS